MTTYIRCHYCFGALGCTFLFVLLLFLCTFLFYPFNCVGALVRWMHIFIRLILLVLDISQLFDMLLQD